MSTSEYLMSCRFSTTRHRHQQFDLHQVEHFVSINPGETRDECGARHLKAILYLVRSTIFDHRADLLEFQTPEFTLRKGWWETSCHFAKRAVNRCQPLVKQWLVELLGKDF